MKNFSIVVAFDSSYGIGKNGRLPWRLPGDLRRFKEITTGEDQGLKKNAVIMGRKTWESLPEKFRPLPNRVNVVLSRRRDFKVPAGVLCFQNLDEALTALSSLNNIGDIFVIGGAEIYASAMAHPLCQKLYVTHVKGAFDCDAFFPPISRQFMPISASEEYEEGGASFHFSEYLRSF
ncbi:MAG: dihydrofolate reductase [Candidatus Omnitrophica bacterium]|nr:dihydrofolate reductase [Candidatus Omnitrophota bacterium]MDE2231052.1 dihydrofolate reductase [Candidatus Omnitrophota bacterium]